MKVAIAANNKELILLSKKKLQLAKNELEVCLACEYVLPQCPPGSRFYKNHRMHFFAMWEGVAGKARLKISNWEREHRPKKACILKGKDTGVLQIDQGVEKKKKFLMSDLSYIAYIIISALFELFKGY